MRANNTPCRGSCSHCEVLIPCWKVPDVIQALGRPWCRCLPLRACAFLFGECSEYEEGGALAHDYMALQCELGLVPPRTDPSQPGYAGTLLFDDTHLIDVKFTFQDTADGLWCILESTRLGYVMEDEYGYDTRIWTAMGGDYNDPDTRKANCTGLDLVFPIDISIVDDSLGYSNACIKLSLADMSHPEWCPPCGQFSGPPFNCICPQACITYTWLDEYGEEQSETIKSCLKNGGWSASFRDDSVQFQIDDLSGDYDPPRFKLINITGLPWPDPVEVEVTCHDVVPRSNMEAEWIAWQGDYEYSGIKVSIKGDHRSGCIDCKCFCSCLCVQYFQDTGGIYMGTACVGEYDSSWTLELRRRYYDSDKKQWEWDEYDTKSVTLYLECDHCTGTTYLKLSGYDVPGAKVNCPDIAGDFFVQTEEESFSVVAFCAGCIPSCPDFPHEVSCCEGEPIPAALHAVFSPSGACPCDEVDILLTWRKFPDSNPPPIYYLRDDGLYAYASAPFTLCDNPSRTFRIWVAPCFSKTGESCYDGTEFWGLWMDPDPPFSGLEIHSSGGCSPCAPVYFEAGEYLCPPGAADYGVWTITVSE